MRTCAWVFIACVLFFVAAFAGLLRASVVERLPNTAVIWLVSWAPERDSLFADHLSNAVGLNALSADEEEAFQRWILLPATEGLEWSLEMRDAWPPEVPVMVRLRGAIPHGRWFWGGNTWLELRPEGQDPAEDNALREDVSGIQSSQAGFPVMEEWFEPNAKLPFMSCGNGTLAVEYAITQEKYWPFSGSNRPPVRAIRTWRAQLPRPRCASAEEILPLAVPVQPLAELVRASLGTFEGMRTSEVELTFSRGAGNASIPDDALVAFKIELVADGRVIGDGKFRGRGRQLTPAGASRRWIRPTVGDFAEFARLLRDAKQVRCKITTDRILGLGDFQAKSIVALNGEIELQRGK